MSEKYINLMNIAIATLAVTLSLLAVLSSRKQQRRDAYFKIQEMLNAPDQHRGRRLLYEYTRKGHLPQDDEEFAEILRSINIWNEVAKMIEFGVVPKDWMISAWHHGLREMRVGYDSIVAYRMANWNQWRPYVALDGLIANAETYKSPDGCCSPLRRDTTEQREIIPRGAQNTVDRGSATT